MKIIHEGKVLKSKTRTGLDKMWQGLVYNDGEEYYIGSRHWQNTKSGATSKVQESEPYIVKPKNLGKANETSPKEQAFLEFDSMVKKQMDKKYLPEDHVFTKADNIRLPMLAQKYSERKHKIVFPAFAQPKLNGMRMIFNGAEAHSRGGKPIIPEVIEHLRFGTKAYVELDGELILPGNKLLQETMKAAKKFRPELSPKLLYCVYDVVDETLPFHERYEYLKNLIENPRFLTEVFGKGIQLVETYIVNNEEDIKKYHKKFTKQGYEGTIIRNRDGLYTVNQRSNDLQKYKDFVDDEFEIISVREGEGQYKGCGIFRCVNSSGIEFDCNPEGTIEDKKEYFNNRKKLIGKWLTIRYQELTNDGVPQFPVGVSVREKGDF